jgi:hypothetical protein
MPHFSCPHCRTVLRFNNPATTTRYSCPQCGGVIQLGGTPGKTSSPAQGIRRSAGSDPGQPQLPAAQAPRVDPLPASRGEAKRLLLLTVVGVALLAAGAGVFLAGSHYERALGNTAVAEEREAAPTPAPMPATPADPGRLEAEAARHRAEAEITKLRASLETERTGSADAKKHLEEVRSDVARLEASLEQERARGEELKRQLRQTKDDASQGEAAAEREKKTVADLRKELQAIKELIGQHEKQAETFHEEAEKAKAEVAQLKRDVAKAKQDAERARVPADKAAWRKLREGMKEEEVRDLLGEPKNIRFEFGAVRWYYGPSGLRPYVILSKNKVAFWEEPESR